MLFKRVVFAVLATLVLVGSATSTKAVFGEYPCTDESDCIYKIMATCDSIGLDYIGIDRWSQGECSGYCIERFNPSGWVWRITVCGGWGWPPSTVGCDRTVYYNRARYYYPHLSPNHPYCADLNDLTRAVVDEWNCEHDITMCPVE